MADTIARALKQKSPFPSLEEEVFVGLRVTVARMLEPWTEFLKTYGLTNSQYNALRILRGGHPNRLTSSEVGERMIARDPDVTRLVDRLTERGLTERIRSQRDRRVVEVGITEAGLALLQELDPHSHQMPKAMLGHLGDEKLRELAELLESAIAEMGTYP
jgi:DNA-binding MarR family transcriptional regulator